MNHTCNSLAFIRACEDLRWNHDKSTPETSETNGIVEKAVRRVTKGTSALLVQSDLAEKWWEEAVECFCYLRIIQDKLAGGKSPYESRFGTQIDCPIIPFGAEVHFRPISTKTKVVFINHLGANVLPGRFNGYALNS